MWKEEYSVNIKEIDDQHKNLVSMINDLHKSMMTGKGKVVLQDVLKRMLNYTIEHFSTEEKYMIKFNFPGYEEHKAAHDTFIDEVHKLSEDFDSGKLFLTIDVMNFLRDWLREHIMKTDKEYSKVFIENGVK